MLLLKLHLFFGWNHVAPQRRVSVPSGLRLICATDLHNCPTVEMFPHKHEYEKCNLFWVDPTYTNTPRAPNPGLKTVPQKYKIYSCLNNDC